MKIHEVTRTQTFGNYKVELGTRLTGKVKQHYNEAIFPI